MLFKQEGCKGTDRRYRIRTSFDSDAAPVPAWIRKLAMAPQPFFRRQTMYWFSPRHHNGWHRGYWGPRYRPCGCGGLGCLWLLLMPLLFCAAWAVLGIMAPVTWW